VIEGSISIRKTMEEKKGGVGEWGVKICIYRGIISGGIKVRETMSDRTVPSA
jgi:hypothetical protein